MRYKILVRKSEAKRDHLKDIDVNGGIILKRVLRKMGYDSVDLDTSDSG
jgi:hypothetical protein